MTAPLFPRRSSRELPSGKELVAAIVVFVLTIPTIFFLGGFTLMSLWNWFVVPAAPSFNALSFWGAIGLYLVAILFKHGLSTYKERDEDLEKASLLGRVTTVCTREILMYVFLLFEGWLIHTYLLPG